jgi:hypothetical protein
MPFPSPPPVSSRFEGIRELLQGLVRALHTPMSSHVPTLGRDEDQEREQLVVDAAD